MKIGIDIDDTTLNTVKAMIKYADKFSQEELGKSDTKTNLGDIKNRYYLNALYGWTNEEKLSFFNMYYKDVLTECEPIKDAPFIINKLKKEGHEIYFISSRLTIIKNCPTEQLTIDNFKKYNIQYNKLIIGATTKLQYCLDNNISIFIDDSYEELESLNKHGIKCFLMTTPMNANIKIENGIKRIHTWSEIYNNIKGDLK